MSELNWQLEMWRQADLQGRRSMLELDEAEPTYLAGCATGEAEYLEGLSRIEADDLVAHALQIAMNGLEATIVLNPSEKRAPSLIIHAFSSPSWVRELEEDKMCRLHGQQLGPIAGFFRTRNGSHSPWKSSIDVADLLELTDSESVVTVWNWSKDRNLADLTHAEEEWKEMRIAEID